PRPRTTTPARQPCDAASSYLAQPATLNHLQHSPAPSIIRYEPRYEAVNKPRSKAQRGNFSRNRSILLGVWGGQSWQSHDRPPQLSSPPAPLRGVGIRGSGVSVFSRFARPRGLQLKPPCLVSKSPSWV